jgi:hypothetical protein
MPLVAAEVAPLEQGGVIEAETVRGPVDQGLQWLRRTQGKI